RRKGHAEVNILEWGIDMKDPKTPTRVFYNVHDQPPKLVGWGTEVPDDSVEHLKLHEGFKVDLGEVDGDNGQVKSLYRDFLTSLYGELSTKRFTPALLGGKNFEEAEVLFHFSVPAIWGPAVVRDFTQLVRDSGFERVGLHSVRVTMMEPQAVAAYEICVPNLDYQLKNGENVLIVDAGGGTTDFCLLKMDDTYEKPPQAMELAPPTACAIGSSYIDRGFEEMVVTYLQDKRDLLYYIVLTGGLGSSRYVLGKIEEFIGESQINFTAKTKVVMSAAPRLSMCMGLVYNAGHNPELFPRRFNRVSVSVASQSLTGAIKKTRLRDLIKRALLRFPKGEKPEGEVEWFLIKVKLHHRDWCHRAAFADVTIQGGTCS
ncbi:hypothetical protein FOC1_g10005783, partial [Fusarium oxysporum f. sp. cubense race 1]